MRYLGGKSRYSKEIARVVSCFHTPGQPYWEPMVGGGWVLAEAAKVLDGPLFASDLHSGLIFMWQMLQRGWTPPEYVSTEAYAHAKLGDTTLAEQAFIGFAGSFGGKWFGGYARGDGRNFCAEGVRALERKRPALQNVLFFQADFLTTPPPMDRCLIYCDPPYAGTTGYKLPFDHDAFWERVRYLDDQGHTVLVSEYNAPQDFQVVWQREHVVSVQRAERHTSVERIFMKC